MKQASPPALTRRRIASAATTLAVLSACVSGRDGDTGSAGERTVKITYLHQWSQNQGHGPATEQLVARFREQVPSIQVEAVFSAEYYPKLTAILAAGDFPDVVTSNVEFLLSIARKQVLVSPETLAKAPHGVNRNDLVPVSREMVTYDGKMAGMPYILSNLGLAYNQTLFRQRGLDANKPPATWDEVVDFGRRLGGASGDTQTWGMQMQRGTGNVPVLTWACHLWQHGGDLVDMTRRVATWNSPAGVEALQWWVDLVHKHQVAAPQQPANLFQNARAGMWHLPTGTMSVVAGAVGTQFEWACAPLPKGRQLASNVGGHALVVLKTGKFHAEAWRFVHWFTAPQNVVEFNIPSTTLPPWQSAQQQPAWQRYVREQPRIKPFTEMLAYGRPPHKLSTWTEVTTALGQGIEAAVTQQMTPKQALDDAARAAQQFIQDG